MPSLAPAICAIGSWHPISTSRGIAWWSAQERGLGRVEVQEVVRLEGVERSGELHVRRPDQAGGGCFRSPAQG